MNTENIFNHAYWALLAGMLLMRFWFAFRVWRTWGRLQPVRADLQREGRWVQFTEYLFFLLLAGAVLLLCFHRGSLRKFDFPAPDWLRWSGIGLGLMSVGLFGWTHVVLGRFWSPGLEIRSGHRLMAAGPYARIRHPMYTAIVGWLLSLGLVGASWIPLTFSALGVVNFLLRIPAEEKMMVEQFGGEYVEYVKRTGRLLPKY
jgi:protein-S-isoprenylcysteine O-methyltransferase Ste14